MPRRRLLAALLIASGLVGSMATPGVAVTLDVGVSAGRRGEAQPMVVVLADSVTDPAGVAAQQAATFDTPVGHVFRHGVLGWSGLLDAADLRAARADGRISRVEPDRLFHTTGLESTAVQTTGVPWGLDRIDQRDLPLDATFSTMSQGMGVTAYVVDTGIRFSHREFSGRAAPGFDAIGSGGEDCNGHGTHVAGTLGGVTFGVAKDVSLVSVRVFGCRGEGSTSDILAGLDWIVAHHQPGVPAVANLSFGGSTSKTIDAAVRRVISDGVTVSIAAGNSKRKACKASPARVTEAITVGASDMTDQKASFSNYGDCVDLFAPGVGILSASSATDDAAGIRSGTSMSAPHVAGVAALFLQGSPGADPAAVARAIGDLAARGRIAKAKTSRNGLLFTNL